MQFYRIALFILAFNLTLSALNSMPINALDSNLNIPYLIQPNNNWNTTADAESITAASQRTGISNLGFGDVIGGIWEIIAALSNATITMPLMLAEFGLPVVIIAIFTGLNWFTWGATIAQWLSGRTMEK
jgi:hypothetical protein